MAFDKTIIDDLLKRTDVVNVISNYITVNKKGRNFVALCPFHDDKNPSLQISRDKQIFKCFVCGEGGNAVQFVQKYEKMGFYDAARKVADLVGYTDERLSMTASVSVTNPELQPYFDCMKDALEYYKFGLTTDQGQVALDYLHDRQLDEAMISRFEIGYSLPDGRGLIQFLLNKGHSRSMMEQLGLISINQGAEDRLAGRLIFPIFDRYGRIVAFSGRTMGAAEGPKYINSPESKIFIKSNILYNFHFARDQARHLQYLYVVEGFMDVIALARVGIDAAVALMGTAFTKNHLAMLRMPDVELRICLDGDDAGQLAMMKMINSLDGAKLKYRFVMNAGDTRDSDEILNSDGPEALKKYLNNLANRLEFAMEYYMRSLPLKTTEQRAHLIKLMVPLLAASQTMLELEDYAKKLGKLTSFNPNTLLAMVSEYRVNHQLNDVETLYKRFQPEARYLSRFKLAERQLLYFMLTDARAIEFYKTKIEYFFDDIYRQIANFIVERSADEELPSINSLLTAIGSLESEKKEAIVKEVTAVAFEKNYPQCSEALLEEINRTITTEREAFHLNQQYQKAIEGKDEAEKARIGAEFNKIRKKRHLK